MGAIDRIIRTLAGVGPIIIGIVTGFWWLFIIAAILLITSAFGICLLYLPLKIRTFSKKEKEKMEN